MEHKGIEVWSKEELDFVRPIDKENVEPDGYLINPYLTSIECPHPFMKPEWDKWVKKHGDGLKKIDMDKLLQDSEQ